MSVFSTHLRGGKYKLFNRAVGERRLDEVLSRLGSMDWYPNQQIIGEHLSQAEGAVGWIDSSRILTRSPHETWMQSPVVPYLYSLPEFDWHVFREVTYTEPWIDFVYEVDGETFTGRQVVESQKAERQPPQKSLI